MKKSNDTIGNRTRDLPACSAVPQPTTLPRAPKVLIDTTHNSPKVAVEKDALLRRILDVASPNLDYGSA